MAVMPKRTRDLAGVARWGLVLLVLPYAAFAVSLAGAELIHQMGGAGAVKERSAPIFFIVHALTGTAALVAGPLQWILASRVGTRRIHRVTGHAYVLAVLIAALTALRMAVTFDVPVAARISFATLAVLWAGTTVVGMRRVLDGDVTSHRRWMTRSYALTLFFLTGPIGMGIAESGVWAYEIVYPVAVTAAWVVNLAIAESWIRWRAGRGRGGENARRRRDESPARAVA